MLGSVSLQIENVKAHVQVKRSSTFFLKGVGGHDSLWVVKIAALVPLASADPLLTESAMAAVSKWTYQPYLLNGEPIDVTTTVTVHFNMNR